MNTIQAKNLAPPVASIAAAERTSNPINAELLHKQSVQANADIYSATAANDAVVARVISSAIDQTLHRSMNDGVSKQDARYSGEARFTSRPTSNESLLDFEAVTNNVVSFVGNALANLAQRGFDTQKLSFFKNEAITGVEVGIDLAKLDLVGMASDKMFTAIDATRDSIIGGIKKLSIEPSDYQPLRSPNNESSLNKYATVDVRSVSNELLTLDFESKAFNPSGTFTSATTYTTSSSNITFSIQGSQNESSKQQLANLMNKIDGLANSFYRGDVQGAHAKSLDLGYSNNEIVGLAKQLNKTDTFQQMKMYGDIQHLDVKSDEAGFTAPKTVAEYVNRYLDVIESSHSVLSTRDDFNQVINGIVNQMKDVQVPDVLQAINRLHAFNNQFS